LRNGIKNFDGVKIATEMINDGGGVMGRKSFWSAPMLLTPGGRKKEPGLITNE
jgi:hypothetical protein